MTAPSPSTTARAAGDRGHRHHGAALMDIVLRATVIFVALYVLVRLMGKRELGQMTPFELIVLVVIGDLIQQGVTQNDFSLTGAIIAVSTIAFLALVMSWASYLWPGAERLLEGEPRVIVRDGELARRQPAAQPADALGDRVGDAAGRASPA